MIGIATVAWGGYWERYGAEFIAAIRAMDPQPNEVVLVSKNVVVSDVIRHVPPESPVCRWDWVNEAVRACHSEWICFTGVDDLFLPDGLRDLSLRGDVMAIGCLVNGVPLPEVDPSEWTNLLTMSSVNWGGRLFRREAFLRFPWRQVMWSDVMQLHEMRRSNLEMSFDPRPRFIWRRHDDSHSARPSKIGDDQLTDMNWLAHAIETVVPGSRIVPGFCWPPDAEDNCGNKLDLAFVPDLESLNRAWDKVMPGGLICGRFTPPVLQGVSATIIEAFSSVGFVFQKS